MAEEAMSKCQILKTPSRANPNSKPDHKPNLKPLCLKPKLA